MKPSENLYLSKRSNLNYSNDIKLEKQIGPIKTEGGKVCKHCHNKMQRYYHGRDWKPTVGKGYSLYWDFCSTCNESNFYKEAFVGKEKNKTKLRKTKPPSRNSKIDQHKIEKGKGEICKKCNVKMIRYTHSEYWLKNNKNNYFEFWDRCMICKRNYNYPEAFKKV